MQLQRYVAVVHEMWRKTMCQKTRFAFGFRRWPPGAEAMQEDKTNKFHLCFFRY